MKTLKQLLTEGRDAPLYHGTSLTAADIIIRDNYMKAGMTYYNEKSISFTRDVKTAWRYVSWRTGARNEGVVFEIDQRRLSQNYKLQPFQFWSREDLFGHEQIRGARVARDEVDDDRFNEFEEQIVNVNGIPNFMKYVTKVMIYSSSLSYIQRYDYILQHPKLYIYTTKKFPNENRVD